MGVLLMSCKRINQPVNTLKAVKQHILARSAAGHWTRAAALVRSLSELEWVWQPAQLLSPFKTTGAGPVVII